MSGNSRAQQPRLSAARLALSPILLLSIMAGLLFVPAGRLDWPDAWALLTAYGLFLGLYAWWGLRRDPDQLRERSQARQAGNVKPWDKTIMAAYTVFLLLMPIVAGLDAGRFRWSAVPLPAKAVAWLALAVAGALIFWALTANTFLSRMARTPSAKRIAGSSSSPPVRIVTSAIRCISASSFCSSACQWPGVLVSAADGRSHRPAFRAQSGQGGSDASGGAAGLPGVCPPCPVSARASHLVKARICYDGHKVMITPLNTPRLTLRRFRPDDTDDLYEYLSDPRVYRFEPGDPLDRGQANQRAVDVAASPHFWAVELRNADKVIGQIYLKPIEPPEHLTCELGYILNPAYQRQGYGAEAAAALVRQALTVDGMHRIVAHCNPDNAASWKLLAKLGFRREGLHQQDIFFRRDAAGAPLWTNTYVYALLTAEVARLP